MINTLALRLAQALDTTPELWLNLQRTYDLWHASKSVEGFMQHQDTINDRLTAVIERLDVPQARIKTLLARMLPRSENGRDA